jgi:sugar/nucleoside kinase (ribokinase family)
VPRFLAVGHVTWDRRSGGDVLGGSASYAALTARRLGWEAAVLTSAGADFEPARDLPGIEVFLEPASSTTRFVNAYGAAGERRQTLLARAAPIGLSRVPNAWRSPDVLLLAPVAGELPAGTAVSFDAALVGATAQGWLRDFAADGAVVPRLWPSPERDLVLVHVLFLSLDDVGGDEGRARALLSHSPLVALTRGWRGVDLLTRDGVQKVAALPRPEVDATGAGDTFAAAFLVRYHETQDPLEAAAFASCAASCAVEGVGASALGDRAEVERRLGLRERLLEEGEWDE